MRIPVFTADWPTAFNKFSKYLGRHWPNEQLKLNTAREATAYLLGYNSVHDVQLELIADNAYSKRLDLQMLISAMTLRALKKYGLNPITATPIFNKLPWRDMGLWVYTDSYAIEKITAEKKKEGFLLIHDEYHLLLNYKTDSNLSTIYDHGGIPRYEYAVNSDGLIYRRETLERLINSVDITDVALKDIEYREGAEQFILETMLPLAWVPVSESLGNIDYQGQWQWELPFMHELQKIRENSYAIKHVGYNAIYPGHYTFEELTPALVTIYRSQPIVPSSSLPNGQQILVGQQLLVRPTPFEDYKKYLESPLLSRFSIPASIDKSWSKKPDSNVLNPDLYNEHLRIRSWLTKQQPVSVRLKTAGSELIKPVLDLLLDGTYRDINTIHAEGDLLLEATPADEDYECRKIDMQEQIDDMKTAGLSVLKYHPELNSYYDAVALGMEFNSYEDQYRSVLYCYRRSLSFLIHIFSKRLQALTNTKIYADTSHFWKERHYESSNIAKVVFEGLFDGKYSLSAAKESFLLGAELYAKFIKQDKNIAEIENYAEFRRQTRSLTFASVGRPYEPTRKSSNDHMSDKIRFGRKYSSMPIVSTQTKQSLTTTLIESLNTK